MTTIREKAGQFEVIEDGLVFARFSTRKQAENCVADRKIANVLIDYRQHQDYLRKTYQQ